MVKKILFSIVYCFTKAADNDDPIAPYLDLTKFAGTTRKCLGKRVHSKAWHQEIARASKLFAQHKAKEMAGKYAANHLKRWRDYVDKM